MDLLGLRVFEGEPPPLVTSVAGQGRSASVRDCGFFGFPPLTSPSSATVCGERKGGSVMLQDVFERRLSHQLTPQWVGDELP